DRDLRAQGGRRGGAGGGRGGIYGGIRGGAGGGRGGLGGCVGRCFGGRGERERHQRVGPALVRSPGFLRPEHHGPGTDTCQLVQPFRENLRLSGGQQRLHIGDTVADRPEP